jgi:sugar lactone lactonase YvrE
MTIAPPARQLATVVALAAAVASPLQAQGLPDRLICGAPNVEDMVAVPETRWIIGSGMGDNHFQGGGLVLIDASAGTLRRIAPRIAPRSARARTPFGSCPGPVAPAAFSAHGLSLAAAGDGKYRLHVINHGARETIEVFELSAGRKPAPVLTWIGCVPTPPTALGNSLAVRANGDIVLSAMAAADVPLPSFYEQSLAAPSPPLAPPDPGQIANQRGAVLIWSPGKGWRKVAGSELAGNNGIELSRDGRHAFNNSWPGENVVRIALDAGTKEPNREIPLGFKPDNIRWSDDGRLVATGHLGTFEQVMACAMGGGSCAVDYRAAAIDPETLAVTPLFTGKATDRFGTATIGLLRQGTLWLGSVRSNCIAAVALQRQ